MSETVSGATLTLAAAADQSISVRAVNLNFSMSPAVGRLQQLGQQLRHSIMACGNTVPAAPWREAFLSHIEQLKQPTFTLSSLHSATPSEPSSTSHLVPRARTVVYRGMWASLAPNPKNSAQLNPTSFQTDLPTVTTDARMEKVSEMFTGSDPDSLSNVGGPVEAVFWFPESMTQWRLRGPIFMIGPDIDSAEASPVKEELMPYMRRVGTSEWNWSRELTAHFGNLSPLMRGTFRNPPPGTPVTQKPEAGLGLGQVVEDLKDEIARKNFRVLVIVPEEVDRVDLSDPERGRRWNYRLDRAGNGAEWSEAELWP